MTAVRGLGRHARLLRHLARAALAELGELGAGLSIAVMDDAAMQRPNRDHRLEDRTTDVLAFSQREGESCAAAAHGLRPDPGGRVARTRRNLGSRSSGR